MEIRIVFTSGVFDILHAGHVNFLEKTKNLVGDKGKLVIASHDDKSVREHCCHKAYYYRPRLSA